MFDVATTCAEAPDAVADHLPRQGNTRAFNAANATNAANAYARPGQRGCK